MSGSGYLGIDLGTSAVKVLVIDDDGAPLARISRPYATHAPRPGWAEQSPADWWQAVCEAAREAVSTAAVPIASVGLSGQLNGFVLLDDRDQPLADAVIWLDIRAEAEAVALSERADFEALTGNALSPICVLPKLAWFQANRPALMKRTKRIVLAKDYVLHRLTGRLATDPSDAQSTAMAEIGGTQWSERLSALAGIETSLLPAILPAAEVAGTVTPAASRACGVPAGKPVATGAGDVAALAVGCGIVAPGRTAITLGTAGHVVAEATAASSTTDLGLWRIPHGIAGRGLWLGLIMSGGLSLSWLRSALAVEAPPAFETLEGLARAVPAGSEGVTFLPFLEGAATPYNRPDARGAFFGLASKHGAGHLVRAVMEGVAFNARQCVEALAKAGAPSGQVRLAEGGAQSPLWCQIIADVLGRPVDLLAERDTSAAGAAILGQAAARHASVEEIVRGAVRIERTFKPDGDHIGILEAGYQRYRERCASLITGSEPAKN